MKHGTPFIRLLPAKDHEPFAAYPRICCLWSPILHPQGGPYHPGIEELWYSLPAGWRQFTHTIIPEPVQQLTCSFNLGVDAFCSWQESRKFFTVMDFLVHAAIPLAGKQWSRSSSGILQRLSSDMRCNQQFCFSKANSRSAVHKSVQQPKGSSSICGNAMTSHAKKLFPSNSPA